MLTILTTCFINSNAAYFVQSIYRLPMILRTKCVIITTHVNKSFKRMTLAQTKHSNSYFYVDPNSEIIE